MHLAMYGQPFSESDAFANGIDNCGLSSEDATQSHFSEVNVLDNMTFNRGDYLFCIKDNQNDECTGSDFQWVDTQTDTLVSSRPASPRQSHLLANSPVTCSGVLALILGRSVLYAAIDTQSTFKLWADYSHGEISHQWPNERDPFADSTIADDPAIAWVEPFLFYNHQDCPNSSCSTEISTGSQLDVTLNFDTTNMIFLLKICPKKVSKQK